MIGYIMAAILFGTTTGLLVAVLIKLVEGINLINMQREEILNLIMEQQSARPMTGKGTTLPS